MNRTLIVSLIQKNIDELILLTEGFAEMKHYPAAILNLAKNKTEDINAYIEMLRDLKEEEVRVVVEDKEVREVREDNKVVAEGREVITEEREVREVNEVREVREDTFEIGKDAEYISETEDKPEFTEIEEEEEVVEIETFELVDEVEDNQEIDEELPAAIEEPAIIAPAIPEPIEITETREIIPEKIGKTDFSDIVEKVEIDAETEIVEVKESANDASKKTTLGDRMAVNGKSRNDMHARTDKSGIHASIANKKVEDIRQAISLGDRFRFQRELFRNNGEEMNKTLSYINLLATYEEVNAFLQSKYGWAEDNEAAQDFYQIVKRKF